MTLMYMDGFDGYVTADLGLRYTVSGSPTISAGNGRRSSAGLSNAGSSSASVTRVIAATTTLIMGAAFYIPSVPSADAWLFSLLDSGTYQCSCYMHTDGTLGFYRGGTPIARSTATLPTGRWNHVEFGVVISTSVGSYDIHLNGTSILSASGTNTQATGNNTANQLCIMNASSVGIFGFSSTIYVDDFYLLNGSGSVNSTFLGDSRVDIIRPNGNGNSSQFVNDAGNSTNNYSHVNEAAEDGDTSYVQSSTIGNMDEYTYGALGYTPSSIYAIQKTDIAKLDVAGSRSIALMTRSGGTDYAGSSQSLTSSYAVYQEVRETDPATGAAWTSSGLGSAQFGAKITA